ncbi:MAG: alpha-L-fucosidase [Carboxylicivirga sp.]|jgi:alpha-L-fucosidase|nr:alpha-L-fucosidase [Carboxylicivirga sp.]
MKKKITCYQLCILLTIALISNSTFAQEKEPTWEELSAQYEFPQWFLEARFGIWLHWGAQTQPAEGGGWYARHMYQKDVGRETWGKGAYDYHVKTYGHPSEKGFKDVINEWKAEKLDADALMKYIKGLGAKYFMIMANHHDHFDNFNSTHHEWNSVIVGPKKDIVGEFEKAAKKYQLPFCVSSHDDRYKEWWLPAFGADIEGPKKGIVYDGRHTKADGAGKWWEGMDPANLYGVAPEFRTKDWHKKVDTNWMNRHIELVTKYDVDLLWFDGYDFPYGKYGKELCRTYYYHSLKKHGKIKAAVAGKFHGEPATIKDVERGGTNEIVNVPWQGTLTFGGWFYKENKPSRHNARTTIENLVDVISKNGNLLLNIELYPDGTIPPKHKAIIDEVGEWVNLNGEAIYATKPWLEFGDNLFSDEELLKEGGAIGELDLEVLKKNKKKEHFNERTITAEPYRHNEVRFTTKGNDLFVFVLNPKAGKIELPTLGFETKFNNKKVKSIQLLGGTKKVKFKQYNDKLVLNVPKARANEYTAVFKLADVL